MFFTTSTFSLVVGLVGRPGRASCSQASVKRLYHLQKFLFAQNSFAKVYSQHVKLEDWSTMHATFIPLEKELNI